MRQHYYHHWNISSQVTCHSPNLTPFGPLQVPHQPRLLWPQSRQGCYLVDIALNHCAAIGQIISQASVSSQKIALVWLKIWSISLFHVMHYTKPDWNWVTTQIICNAKIQSKLYLTNIAIHHLLIFVNSSWTALVYQKWLLQYRRKEQSYMKFFLISLAHGFIHYTNKDWSFLEDGISYKVNWSSNSVRLVSP